MKKFLLALLACWMALLPTTTNCMPNSKKWAAILVASSWVPITRWLSPAAANWRRKTCAAMSKPGFPGGDIETYRMKLPVTFLQDLNHIPQLYVYQEGETAVRLTRKNAPFLSLAGAAGTFACDEIYDIVDQANLIGVVSVLKNGRAFSSRDLGSAAVELRWLVSALPADPAVLRVWTVDKGPIEYFAWLWNKTELSARLWYKLRASTLPVELTQIDGVPLNCTYGFSVPLVTDLDGNGFPELAIVGEAGDTEVDCLYGMYEFDGQRFRRF